jgi:hypothetical protein
VVARGSEEKLRLVAFSFLFCAESFTDLIVFCYHELVMLIAVAVVLGEYLVGLLLASLVNELSGRLREQPNEGYLKEC